MIRVHLHERAYQRRLADAGRTDHGDQGGRTLLDPTGTTIVEGDLLLLLGPVQIPLDVPLGPNDVRDRIRARIVLLLPCAGLRIGLVLLLFPSTPTGLSRLVIAIDLIVDPCG